MQGLGPGCPPAGNLILTVLPAMVNLPLPLKIRGLGCRAGAGPRLNFQPNSIAWQGQRSRAKPLPPGAIATVADKRSEPRIPFAAMVEAGLLRAGEILVDEKEAARRDSARRWHGFDRRCTGSIHKIGALVQGLPACNGWTFWHFFRAGRYQPIDALRSLVRASLRPAAE